jgi:ZIP family zinc transporter
VVEAFLWGAIGAAALLIGALIAYFLNPSRQVIAIVVAIGTGLLIGSVSFELVDDALENQAVAGVAAMVLLGALVFTAGNWLLDRYGGRRAKIPLEPSRMLRPWRLSWDRCWTAFRSHSYWV